jgi:transposase InsO family protein
MRRGFLYLVAIMDWFSRKVLAWRLSNTMDAVFCIDEALKEALAKHGTPEVFNTPSRALLRNTLPGSGSRQPVHQRRLDRGSERCKD